MKHTPTPWTISEEWIDDNGTPTLSIFGQSKHGCMTIADLQHTLVNPSANEQTANAAFIVRACNSHDELLAALKGTYGALKIALKCNHFTADEYAQIGEWTDEARAAIEKATK